MKNQLKTFIVIIITLFLPEINDAQDITFRSTDDFIEVYKGTEVTIKADTAYILSKSRASFIDKRLDQLDSLKRVYNSLFDNREELLSELEATQEILEKISDLLSENGTIINDDFREIIEELDKTITNLKTNNEQLKTNNKSLKKEIDDLHSLVKKLRKETRAIWWDGLTDKVVVFVGGVGVGALLFLLL